MSDIIFYNDAIDYIPSFTRELKSNVKNGLYSKHSFPPLYSEKDILKSDITFGITTIIENNFTVFIRNECQVNLIRKVKRILKKKRDYDPYRKSTIYALVSNGIPFYIGSTTSHSMSSVW